MINGSDWEVKKLKKDMEELRSEILFIKGLREEDKMAYSMEIQTLKARLDAVEGLRIPYKIDESLKALDHSVTYDHRTNKNLLIGNEGNSTKIRFN